MPLLTTRSRNRLMIICIMWTKINTVRNKIIEIIVCNTRARSPVGCIVSSPSPRKRKRRMNDIDIVKRNNMQSGSSALDNSILSDAVALIDHGMLDL